VIVIVIVTVIVIVVVVVVMVIHVHHVIHLMVIKQHQMDDSVVHLHVMKVKLMVLKNVSSLVH